MRAVVEREVTVPAPDDVTCRRYYEQNSARFRSPDIYEASHILFAALPADREGYAAARADAAAGEAVDRLPVGDTERAGAGLGRLNHGLRHKHPLARLEAAGLEHPLRCLPAGHAATTIGEG